MFDIWGFLLQTLTASGVALLLLVIKALFRDKLSPKWQFAVWSALGIMLMLPAGMNGRYPLFHWQVVVELIKSWCGDFSFTCVLFPVPFIKNAPKKVADWIFVIYVAGVIISIMKYVIAYIRLRMALRLSAPPCSEMMARVTELATAQSMKRCHAVVVSGVPSALVCGVFRPVLVLPVGNDIDDKVLLHELLHMKYRDTFWNVVICFFRCVHWCNPFLAYCANRALSDMEARCDQRVLDQLEGEERRDYGRILLSMANERFAKTPGSTCIHNGGKQIRKRIECIARFKKYPVGMGVVSVCVIMLLSISLVVGVEGKVNIEFGIPKELQLASARSTPCMTPAGAFDTYGKAMLEQSGVYRVMCAPESAQAELFAEIMENDREHRNPDWDDECEAWPYTSFGYYIYNLKQCEKYAYEALFVMRLNFSPFPEPENEGMMYLAMQNLRVEQQKGRWVAIPLEEFRYLEAKEQNLEWGSEELPGMIYTGTASNIRADVKVQTVHIVDNTVQDDTNNWLLGSGTSFDTTPKPSAKFDLVKTSEDMSCTHLGTEAERESITHIGLSVASVYFGEERPKYLAKAISETSGGSNEGRMWSSCETTPGWGPTIRMSGGGSSFEPTLNTELPLYYVADLYVNKQLFASMDLCLQEGVIE